MRVAIIGGSPSSWALAPFDDESWEIWVLGNQIDRYMDSTPPKRVTRIFEIHDDISQHPEWYPQFLADTEIPLVVGPKFPVTGKHIKLFPEQRARDMLDDLSSSPAYMMAMALIEGAEEIGIYGVDMAVDDHEYFKQRPGMYAWIGYAKAKGVKVTIPDESSLFKGDYIEGRDWRQGNPEGLAPFTEAELLSMAREHDKRMEGIEGQIDALKMQLNAHAGAKQAYDRMAKVARGVAAGQRIQTLAEGAEIR